MTFTSIEAIWRRYDAVEARLTAGLSERMLELAGVRAGMRVLDLATGRGEPAIRAAQRVGVHGHVVGVEPDAGVLQIAREHAARAGVENLELHCIAAESLDQLALAELDVVTIRWGLMFMADPVGALAQARRAMKPTAVLVVATWAEPERVEWFTLPRRVLERYRSLPAIDPDAPGTFRYADVDRIDRDFAAAGLAIDHVEEMELPVFEASTTDELVAWARAFGLTRLLQDLPAEIQRAWEADFAREMEARRTDGVLRLVGVTRIVRARPRDQSSSITRSPPCG